MMIVLCMAALVACNRQRPTPTPPYNTLMELAYLSGIYYDNYYGATENDYNYSLALSTTKDCFDIVTGETHIYTNQTYLFLDLYAAEPSENYNIRFSVPTGEYTFDNTNSATAGTISAEYSYLYETFAKTGKETYFKSGSVVVTTARIDAILVDEYGTEHRFRCPNRVVNNKNNFKGIGLEGRFTTLNGDHTITFNESDYAAENYGDYYVIGKDLWTLYIEDLQSGEALVFELLTPQGLTFPEGEFEISSSLDVEYAALPGFVASDGSTMWSWYYHYDKSGTIVGNAPIKSGTLSVRNSDGKPSIKFEVVDDRLNKISGEL